MYILCILPYTTLKISSKGKKGSTPETFLLRCMYLKNGDEFLFLSFLNLNQCVQNLNTFYLKKDAQNIVLNNINHYVLLPGP